MEIFPRYAVGFRWNDQDASRARIFSWSEQLIGGDFVKESSLVIIAKLLWNELYGTRDIFKKTNFLKALYSNTRYLNFKIFGFPRSIWTNVCQYIKLYQPFSLWRGGKNSDWSLSKLNTFYLSLVKFLSASKNPLITYWYSGKWVEMLFYWFLDNCLALPIAKIKCYILLLGKGRKFFERWVWNI